MGEASGGDGRAIPAHATILPVFIAPCVPRHQTCLRGFPTPTLCSAELYAMIELLEAGRIGIGQFADVFHMQDQSRVCKIYRAEGSRKWRQWADRIQRQELKAYEIAASNPTLRDNTARCFGPVVVSKVRDRAGDDIAVRYLLSTAFVLEYLSGEEEKAMAVDASEYPYIYELLDAFDVAGIDAADASVFAYKAHRTVRFVDITTKYGAQMVAEIV